MTLFTGGLGSDYGADQRSIYETTCVYTLPACDFHAIHVRTSTFVKKNGKWHNNTIFYLHKCDLHCGLLLVISFLERYPVRNGHRIWLAHSDKGKR
jgi:hypothetical protein